MGEKQEKVWVVLKHGPFNDKYASGDLTDYGDVPVKVFDDRKDARAYTKTIGKRAKLYTYSVVGCKKG